MVLHDPVFLHRQGISDHAPLVVSLSMRPRADPAILPRHRECCSHKRFSERLQATCDAATLDGLHNSERLRLHKFLIREAVLKAREEIFQSEPNSKYMVAVTISSMARAVWNNDAQLMKTLHRRSEIAREYLHFTNKVEPIDLSKFADLVEKHR